MRPAPSIATALPDDNDVYLVLDDFGKLGRSWRESDEERTDRDSVIADLVGGQYHNPVRVIAFNTAERWSRDVSEEIADALVRRFLHDDCDVPGSLKDFIERHGTPEVEQLPLPLRGAA